MRDLYADLGVAKDATDDQIKAAWRAKAMQSHTDHGGSKEAFMNARAAYETLRDPKLRAAYDGARAGKIDPKIFQDLFVDMVKGLGPEFEAMRSAAVARNWLRLGVGGVKIGIAGWIMSTAARALLSTSEPQPKPEREQSTVQRRRKALR